LGKPASEKWKQSKDKAAVGKDKYLDKKSAKKLEKGTKGKTS
jgi:hypothetical protein